MTPGQWVLVVAVGWLAGFAVVMALLAAHGRREKAAEAEPIPVEKEGADG